MERTSLLWRGVSDRLSADFVARPLLILAALAGLLTAPVHAQERRPNIVVILADDTNCQNNGPFSDNWSREY
jgi:hypothetical protein